MAPLATERAVALLKLPELVVVNFPALTFVAPVYIFSPLSSSVPSPVFVNPPVPEITPPNVVSAPDAPVVS